MFTNPVAHVALTIVFASMTVAGGYLIARWAMFQQEELLSGDDAEYLDSDSA